MTCVMGLDLSLRASGVVIIPEGWISCDWNALASCVVGVDVERGKEATEADRISRLLFIADSIVEIARERGVTHVFVERYAFAKAWQSHQLGELGGVVKARLAERLGLYPQPVSVASARKLLMGTLPRKTKKVKDVIRDMLFQAGVDFPTLDESDAFVVANYGLAETGGMAVSFAPKEL